MEKDIEDHLVRSREDSCSVI